MDFPNEAASRGQPRAALFRLRLALALFGAGALVRGPWDMLWHLEHAFETFFSPPHLFIYGLSAAAMAPWPPSSWMGSSGPPLPQEAGR